MVSCENFSTQWKSIWQFIKHWPQNNWANGKRLKEQLITLWKLEHRVVNSIALHNVWVGAKTRFPNYYIYQADFKILWRHKISLQLHSLDKSLIEGEVEMMNYLICNIFIILVAYLFQNFMYCSQISSWTSITKRRQRNRFLWW